MAKFGHGNGLISTNQGCELAHSDAFCNSMLDNFGYIAKPTRADSPSQNGSTEIHIACLLSGFAHFFMALASLQNPGRLPSSRLSTFTIHWCIPLLPKHHKRADTVGNWTYPTLKRLVCASASNSLALGIASWINTSSQGSSLVTQPPITTLSTSTKHLEL